MAEEEQEQEQEEVEDPFITGFKLLLIGDEGVGKKEFITRFGVTPEETIRHQVILHTYRGPIKFNIWDCNVERDVSEVDIRMAAFSVIYSHVVLLF